MKQPEYNEKWPQSWKESYPYDLLEVFGQKTDYGYYYSYRNRQQKALNLIKQNLPVGSTVLDIAGAQGNFSLSLAEAGYRVTWNDLRADLVDYVKLKYERGEINFAPGNAFELDFREPFDCVLATEVIEHVAHPDQFLRQLSELVRPGGLIVITTPNGAYLRNDLPRFSECENPEQFEAMQFKPNSDGHIFLLWPEEIEKLASDVGLTLKKMDLFTNLLTRGHLKTNKLLPYIPEDLVRLLEKASVAMPRIISQKLLFHMSAAFQKNS